jgi:glycosyltransferase involved in cell wall biosynthesis
LASGVPVLASDRGGLPELVGRSAVLAADDPAAWASALEWLWHDPAARRELGSRALERARNRFSEDRYHQRLMAAYRG